MEKKAYLKPEMEVLVMGLSSMIANSNTSKVIDVSTNLSGSDKIGIGGKGTSDNGGKFARGNERADGLSDWNVKLW